MPKDIYLRTSSDDTGAHAWIFHLFFCGALATILVFRTYPFIGLADGFTRWNLAKEIAIYGKIQSDTLLSPVIPYIQAWTWKLTNSYAAYTWLQAFCFYVAIGMMLELCISRIYIWRFPLWNLLTCVLLLLPCVSIFPLLLTDSAPIFTLIAAFVWLEVRTQTSKWERWKIPLEIALAALCVGIRINSAVLFLCITLWFLGKGLVLRRKRDMIFAGALAAAIFVGAVLPGSLVPKKRQAASLGMLWELVGIAVENDNLDLKEQLARFGDMAEAEKRYGEPYLNALVFDRQPPFSAYDVSGQYSSEIIALYFRTMVQYPGQFVKMRLHIIARTLGIGERLTSSARGIHYVDNTTQSYGAFPSTHAQRMRTQFVTFTDTIWLLSLCPWVMFLLALALSVCALRFRRNRAPMTLWVVSVAYYLSFCLNTQAFEFRYYAPSFFMALVAAVTSCVLLLPTGREIVGALCAVLLAVGIAAPLWLDFSGSMTDTFCATALTDAHWTAGIMNANPSVILFEYSPDLLARAEASQEIIFRGNALTILDVKVDGRWMSVTVDGDASQCAYPARFRFR